MILTLSRSALLKRPDLLDQMHRGRRDVFHTRMGWSVRVQGDWEIDSYDEAAEPTYLLKLRDDIVNGSLRILPTTGPNMLAKEFFDVFHPTLFISERDTWECTRFCVHPSGAGSERRTSAELLIGLCRFCLAEEIASIVGVYERKMERVYSRIGWTPRELACSALAGPELVLGRWTPSHDALAVMSSRQPRNDLSGISSYAA